MQRFKNWLSAGVVLFALFVAGCGTVQTTSKFDGEMLAPDMRMAVGEVTNQTGAEFPDANLTQLLKDALTKRLADEKMLWISGEGNHALIDAGIMEYDQGNAFKRWLLPGWGSTVITVKCDVKDSKGTLLGSIDAHRTVSAGGLYTIGAWESIFRDVADDIVQELKEKGFSRAAMAR